MSNTCEWRLPVPPLETIVHCTPGQQCEIETGLGTPDATYRGLYCKDTTQAPNCGQIYCPVGPDWTCLDKMNGYCVTTVSPS